MQKGLVIFGLVIILVSCASMKPQRPAGFETYDSVVIDVVSAAPTGEEQAQMLQNMIVEALREQRIFQSVQAATDEGKVDSLIIRGKVTRLIKVDNPLRIALGEVAGSNEIAADITVMDGMTQQSLSSFHLKGESPEHPPATDWPWGSIETAMERLSRRLVGILLDWKQSRGAGVR